MKSLHFNFIFVSTCLFIISACTTTKTQQRPAFKMDEILAEREFTQPTYVDSLEKKYITTINPKQSNNDNEVSLLIDSTGDKVFFPFEKEPRQFDSEELAKDFIRETFTSNDDNSNDEVSGVYQWTGLSYFYDPEPGIAYRVTDPFLAKLGGTTGNIIVGQETICVDPDGECEDGYASYLEPVGQTTARQTLDHCGRLFAGVPVCVRHHTFFNRVDFFFFVYLKHGTNARFTTWAALPTSEMLVDFQLPFVITIIGGDPVVGQNFHETGVYCLSNCVFAPAQVVCGTTRITDPDLVGTRVTGNGPLNDTSRATCP